MPIYDRQDRVQELLKSEWAEPSMSNSIVSTSNYQNIRKHFMRKMFTYIYFLI
jgi:hypothetical protein